MLKIYEDIMSEVVSSLEKDAAAMNLSKSVIGTLYNEWQNKLNDFANKNWGNEADGNRDMYIQRYPGYDALRRRGRGGAVKDNDNVEEVTPENDDYNDDYVSDPLSSDGLEMIEDNNDNYMICLYVKVTKSKNKWKCTFKQGFINIGNIDFAFSTAQGELEW